MSATDELLRLLDGFEHECFMLRVEASETRAKDEAVRDAYERIREESARAIAATLGKPMTDANLEQALSFMRIWISEDAHLGESELSAAFEKAEGLRKLDAIERAIAATLGGGECKLVEVDSYSGERETIHVLECSACGKTCEHVNGIYPKCPHCGKDAVNDD